MQGHIIAEVCDADNESLLDRLGFSSILHTVVSQTMAQCMLVQGARQPQVNVLGEMRSQAVPSIYDFNLFSRDFCRG